jgi:hypothetical protein
MIWIYCILGVIAFLWILCSVIALWLNWHAIEGFRAKVRLAVCAPFLLFALMLYWRKD